MSQLQAPTGVTVRYQGNALLGTSQFWYWIQALFPEGYSPLSALAPTAAKCPASFDQNNFVAVQWNPAPGAIGYLVWRTTTSSPPSSGTNELFIATSETGIKDDGSLILQSGTVSYSSIFTSNMYAWHALYSFAVDGGAQGAIVPVTADTIPAYALIVGGVVNSSTAVTSGGSATVAIGTSAGSAANSILTATGKSSLDSDAVLPAAAAVTTPFKMSAAGKLQLTIAAADLTAGVIEIFVYGFQATNA